MKPISYLIVLFFVFLNYTHSNATVAALECKSVDNKINFKVKSDLTSKITAEKSSNVQKSTTSQISMELNLHGSFEIGQNKYYQGSPILQLDLEGKTSLSTPPSVYSNDGLLDSVVIIFQ